MAKPKHPGRRWRIVRYCLIAVLVIAGVMAQFAWLFMFQENESGAGVDAPSHGTLLHNIGSVGLALLVCALLLCLPEGIQWARQAYRDHQEFKDRFR